MACAKVGVECGVWTWSVVTWCMIADKRTRTVRIGAKEFIAIITDLLRFQVNPHFGVEHSSRYACE